MSALTQLALPTMGKLRAKSAPGDSAASITLPQSGKHDSLPLMDALARRDSSCGITRDALRLVASGDLGCVTRNQHVVDETPCTPSFVEACGPLRRMRILMGGFPNEMP